MEKTIISKLTFCLIPIIIIYLNSCNKCNDKGIYLGLSAANKGDDLGIFINDTLVYEKKFNDHFTWDNNNMPKLVDNYCSKDSILKIELKMINSNEDTLFKVNTNIIRGLYISTATAAHGVFFLMYDYYDGGLIDVIWTDDVHP